MNIHKAINYHMRNGMVFDEAYSLDTMYSVYTRVMNLDEFITFKKANSKSLGDMLTEWSNVEDGWLIKIGEGRAAMYRKRYPIDPLTASVEWIRFRIWKR